MLTLKNLPFAIGLGYNLVSIIFLYLGPLQFKGIYNIKFTLFVTSIFISMIMGYISYNKISLEKKLNIRSELYKINIAFFITSLGIIIANIFFSPFNVIGFKTAIADPYFARELENIKKINYFSLVTDPFSLYYFILIPVYWKFINRSKKYLWVLLLISSILTSIIHLQRHGIFSTIVFFTFSVIAGNISGYLKIKLKTQSILLVVFVSSFLMFSNFIVNNRRLTQTQLIELSDKRDDYSIKFNHVVFKVLDPKYYNLVISTNYYFSHSYYYLNEALQSTFTGVSFPFGNSRFLTRNVTRIIGEDNYIIKNSYWERLQRENIMLGTKWFTFFPWIASDLTFIGSIIFIFYFFRFYKYLINQLQINPKSEWIVLFVLMSYQFISFPQGSIMQDGQFVFLVLYFIYKALSLKVIRRAF